ncbi:MAG: hypothetical protein QME12_05375 [Nanoarchaeota archaeon]|nr:hypothetical protein [Nanoarchaeota archaeon]
MTLLNLTEAYLKQAQPSLCDRVRMYFSPEVYYASSLSAIEEFKQSPPKKKDPYFESLSAYVILDSLELKLIDSRLLTKARYAPLIFLNPFFSFPAFHIRDISAARVALWGAGNRARFNEASSALALNTQGFSCPCKVYLQYMHSDQGGFLLIKGFGNSITKPKKRLFERLAEIFPDIGEALPHEC